MKYIIFCRDFKPLIGGVAEYVSNLAGYLHKKDHLAYVLTHLHQNEDSIYRVEISAMKHERKLTKRILDEYVIFRKINSIIHYSILHLQAIVDCFPILLKKDRYKVVIGSYYDYQTSIFIDVCKFFSIPYDIVIHGYDLIAKSDFYLKKCLNHCRSAKRLVFNSYATKSLYQSISEFQPEQKRIILYPALKKEYIDQITNNPLALHDFREPDKFLFTSVTRLTKRKGIDIAIRICVELHTLYPHFKYIICGSGEEEETLKQLVHENGADAYIKFQGVVSEKQKYNLLMQSDVFLMPTHNVNDKDWEGFGISFIEAGYLKNLIVSGVNGGTVEAVNRNLAICIDKFSDEQLKAVVSEIKKVLSNPVVLEKRKDLTSIWVVENFTFEKVINDFLTND